MAMLDPQTMIRQAQPGLMVYARLSRGPAAPMETGLLIRELPRFVKRIGANPPIELRCGALDENGVILIVVMVKFSDEMLYETWFNYHANQQECHDMATQVSFPIIFFQPEKARILEINNPFRSAFANANAIITERPVWSLSQFDAARAEIYKKYAEVSDLWNEIR